jgi:hypothetical protein
MIVNVGGLSAFQGLRKWSWMWVLAHHQPKCSHLGMPHMHLMLSFCRSCISSSCIHITDMGPVAYPDDSGFSSAVLKSLDSPASSFTQMRHILLLHTGQDLSTEFFFFLEKSLPETLQDVPLHICWKMWSCMIRLQLTSACKHENASMLFRTMDWVWWSPFFFWSACSPDLNPFNVFIWEHLRCLIYEIWVEWEDDLLSRIQAACDKTRQTADIFDWVQQSMVQHCGLCNEFSSHHFEELL